MKGIVGSMFVRLVVGIASLLLMAPVADAQTFAVEGGLLGTGASDGYYTDSAGGVFVGGQASLPDVNWLQPYANLVVLPTRTTGFSAGAGLRISPAEWIARPQMRVGFAYGDFGVATVGAGIHVGRRGGGLFTVDWATSDGVGYAIVRMGAYYGF